MKKLIAKLTKKIFRAVGRFLWPEKKKKKKLRWKDLCDTPIFVPSKERLKQQMRDGLDEVTPQCRGIIQGAFDRAYGSGVVEPVYVSREALSKSLTPDMVPDPSLPRQCPQCSGALMLSKKDNRVCACKSCSIVYLTKAANDDPNIQADITHCKANIHLEPMGGSEDD